MRSDVTDCHVPHRMLHVCMYACVHVSYVCVCMYADMYVYIHVTVGQLTQAANVPSLTCLQLSDWRVPDRIYVCIYVRNRGLNHAGCER
jgi:hypothetical protein